ncbi:MAG: hypothetical protein GWN71_03990, partial [Gammaproteobacteria bacterium]|nr:hypothetical protein [Gammaproteobacteria bacterium]
AALFGVLVHQQRFYGVSGDISATWQDLEQVPRVLQPELLPLNSDAGDILYAGTDSMRFRGFRGVFAVCAKALTTDVLLTVRPVAPAEARLRADSGFVYSRGTNVSTSDDSWIPIRVSSVKDETCPDGTPGQQAVVSGLAGILSQIPVGAAVRMFDHASYWLATQDGNWVLKTDGFGGVTTVAASSLMPTDQPAASALRFRYLDNTGAPTGTLAEIVSVEIEIGAMGEYPPTRGGTPVKVGRTIELGLRNTL